MLLFILLCCIFLLAGLVQGVTGFGAGLVAIPLLCMVIDVKQAVPLCLLNGIMITCYLAYALRTYLDHKKILPLIIGSLPGVALGALSFQLVNPSVLRMFIGLVLISYSSYALFARIKPLNPSSTWGYIAGFFAGTITALLSTGGPPAIIYTTLTSWTKEEIKATLTGFFAVNSIVTTIAHVLTGATTSQTLLYFITTVPFVLTGTALGSMLSGKIPRKAYLRIVYVFLIGMGILMIL